MNNDILGIQLLLLCINNNMTFSIKTYGILSQFKSLLVAPPCIITVNITIKEVVVNIACRASETVFLIAKAKDIAPLRPAKKSIC